MYVFHVGMIGFSLCLCCCVLLLGCCRLCRSSGACGVGVSDVYMLKSVGDRTPSWGTPFLNWRCVDFCF